MRVCRQSYLFPREPARESGLPRRGRLADFAFQVYPIALLRFPLLAQVPGDQKLDWDVLFKTSESLCNIFQLASLDPHTKQLVVEFVLWDLFAFARANGSKNDPKVIVLDEVQNLDHGEEGPLAKFLTEGRKFGICAILATQTICNLKKEHQSRLFQAGHKLFFKPAETEIREYAKILNSISLDSVNGWAKCLNLLKKGECISIGLHSPQKIKISSLESREGTPPSSPGG